MDLLRFKSLGQYIIPGMGLVIKIKITTPPEELVGQSVLIDDEPHFIKGFDIASPINRNEREQVVEILVQGVEGG